jgi:hypothetical protein
MLIKSGGPGTHSVSFERRKKRWRSFLEENELEHPTKLQISNRQLSVDSGTLLRSKTGAEARAVRWRFKD